MAAGSAGQSFSALLKARIVSLLRKATALPTCRILPTWEEFRAIFSLPFRQGSDVFYNGYGPELDLGDGLLNHPLICGSYGRPGLQCNPNPR